MRNRGAGRINDIFPILLFLVFTLSALGIVLASVRIYQQILKKSDSSYDTETAISYMTEKFRSHDENGSIQTGSFKGLDAVVMRSRVAEDTYVTCIYAFDGYLRELYVKESLLGECTEESGVKILEMGDFKAETVSEGLIHLRFTDISGDATDSYLSVQSREAPENTEEGDGLDAA